MRYIRTGEISIQRKMVHNRRVGDVSLSWFWDENFLIWPVAQISQIAQAGAFFDGLRLVSEF